ANLSGNDFYDAQPGRICGRVLDDLDSDGQLDPEDTNGLAGVMIVLADTNGTTVANLNTDTNGGFCFSNVAPGEYILIETDPAGYAGTADSDGANDNRIGLALLSAEISTNHVFLDALAGSIGGTVLIDSDGDGMLDPEDTNGIAGVSMTLVDSNGMTVATNLTGPAGQYLFTHLIAGNYLVQETDPAGFFSTEDADGGNDNRIALSLSRGGTETGNFFLNTPLMAMDCNPNEAFVLDWNTVNWPRDAGAPFGYSTTNNLIAITNLNGDVVNLTITISGGTNGSFGCNAFGTTNCYPGFDPAGTNGFAGDIDDLGVVWDPATNQPSPVIIEVQFDREVENIQFLITDIDEDLSATNPLWRLDEVAVTGTNAAGMAVSPQMTAINTNPTFVITGNVSRAFDGAGASANNDSGTVHVAFPAGIERFVITYNDLANTTNPAARGIGILGGFQFCPGPYLAKTLVTSTNGSVPSGNTIDFDLVLTNWTALPMTNLALLDTFDPMLLSFTNATIAPDIVGLGTLNWTNLGAIAPGSGLTIRVQFIVNPVIGC
ncbi:MAG: SdrD B-like domain-containing protein, partial [Verrucomicrobiota bacterium]